MLFADVFPFIFFFFIFNSFLAAFVYKQTNAFSILQLNDYSIDKANNIIVLSVNIWILFGMKININECRTKRMSK